MPYTAGSTANGEVSESTNIKPLTSLILYDHLIPESHVVGLKLPREVALAFKQYLEYAIDFGQKDHTGRIVNHGKKMQGYRLLKDLKATYGGNVWDVLSEASASKVSEVQVEGVFVYTKKLDDTHSFGIGPVHLINFSGQKVARVSSEPVLVYAQTEKSVTDSLKRLMNRAKTEGPPSNT